MKMLMLFWKRRGSNWQRPLAVAAAVVLEEAEAMAEERALLRRRRLLQFRPQSLLNLLRTLPH